MKVGINTLVKVHDTENPISDRGLMYLKIKQLSEKQKNDIFKKGPMEIKLKFLCKNVDEHGKEKSYLTFKVVGLKKLEEQSYVPLDEF